MQFRFTLHTSASQKKKLMVADVILGHLQLFSDTSNPYKPSYLFCIRWAPFGSVELYSTLQNLPSQERDTTVKYLVLGTRGYVEFLSSTFNPLKTKVLVKCIERLFLVGRFVSPSRLFYHKRDRLVTDVFWKQSVHECLLFEKVLEVLLKHLQGLPFPWSSYPTASVKGFRNVLQF